MDYSLIISAIGMASPFRWPPTRLIWAIHWIDTIGEANGTPWWWCLWGELCWCLMIKWMQQSTWWVESRKLSSKKVLSLLLQPDSGLLFQSFSSEENDSRIFVSDSQKLGKVQVEHFEAPVKVAVLRSTLLFKILLAIGWWQIYSGRNSLHTDGWTTV